MEIVNPTVRRGLPQEGKVKAIILVLCKKCGYDEKNVTLTHIGGDRRKSFPKCGVKLIRYRPFTVQMFIGCSDETVETQFQLKNVGGRAVSGESLYRAMETTFGSRTFLVDNGMLKEMRHEPNTLSPDTKRDVQSASHATKGPDLPVVKTTLSLDAGQAAQMQRELPVTTTSSLLPNESHPSDYKGYFKDEEKVQLVVLALVTRFQVDEPFGFEQFTEVLSDEMKITLQSSAMASMMQVFTNRGYVVRLNPKKSPARYVLTTSAVVFASATSPLEKTGVRHKRQAPPVAVSPVPKAASPEPAPPGNKLDLTGELSLLKQEEVEFQKMLGDIKRLEGEVARVNIGELASEEKNLEGEARSLNQRLMIITGRLAEITGIRHGINAKSNQVLDIQRHPRFKELLQRHEEYEKLWKLFTGSS